MNMKFTAVVMLHTHGEVKSDEKTGTYIFNADVYHYPVVAFIHTPGNKLDADDEEVLKRMIVKQMVDHFNKRYDTGVESKEAFAIPMGPVKPGQEN